VTRRCDKKNLENEEAIARAGLQHPVEEKDKKIQVNLCKFNFVHTIKEYVEVTV
jgi:hypothetical protein